MPPAAKTLFVKRVLDSQKLLFNKKFLEVSIIANLFIKRFRPAGGIFDEKFRKPYGEIFQIVVK
jgi:hypothetical protein